MRLDKKQKPVYLPEHDIMHVIWVAPTHRDKDDPPVGELRVVSDHVMLMVNELGEIEGIEIRNVLDVLAAGQRRAREQRDSMLGKEPPVTRSLEEFLKSLTFDPNRKFEPFEWYEPDVDYLELYWDESEGYSRWLNPHISIHVAHGDENKVVGCFLEGIRGVVSHGYSSRAS